MPENMMNSDHKSSNKNSREGWDRTFKHLCGACGFDFDLWEGTTLHAVRRKIEGDVEIFCPSCKKSSGIRLKCAERVMGEFLKWKDLKDPTNEETHGGVDQRIEQGVSNP